jgi:hypothetical protein
MLGLVALLQTAKSRLLRALRPSPAEEAPHAPVEGTGAVHFLHIGKTGGTAVRAALEPYLDERGIVYHGHAVHLPDVPQGDFCCFFVRDPVTRFVSGFYSRQRKGQPRIYSPWTPDEERAFAAFTTPSELATALSAPSRRARKAAENAMRAIGHVRSSYWNWFVDEAYLSRRSDAILFVGAQEQLADDFERLKALLHIPSGSLPNDDVAAHRNPSGLDTTLDAQAVENLRNWYARDYRFLALMVEQFPQLPSYERPE